MRRTHATSVHWFQLQVAHRSGYTFPVRYSQDPTGASVLAETMAAIDPTELAARVAEAPGTGRDTYLAKRQIVAWQGRGLVPDDIDTQEAVKLYLGLKALTSEPITANMFKNWNRTLSASTALKKRIWLVPVANLADPELRQPVQPFLVDSATCDAPPGVDLGDYYIVDQCCERSRLGLGVLELEVSVKVGRQCNIVQGSPAAVLTSGTSSGSGGSTALAALPAARTLARTPSVPDESAAELIATHTKRLFGEGKLTGGDQNHQCVEFWMKQMLAHLQSLRKKDKDL